MTRKGNERLGVCVCGRHLRFVTMTHQGKESARPARNGISGGDASGCGAGASGSRLESFSRARRGEIKGKAYLLRWRAGGGRC